MRTAHHEVLQVILAPQRVGAAGQCQLMSSSIQVDRLQALIQQKYVQQQESQRQALSALVEELRTWTTQMHKDYDADLGSFKEQCECSRQKPPPTVQRLVEVELQGSSCEQQLADLIREHTIEMFAKKSSSRLWIQFLFWTEAEQYVPLQGGAVLEPCPVGCLMLMGGHQLTELRDKLKLLLSIFGDVHLSRVMKAEDIPEKVRNCTAVETQGSNEEDLDLSLLSRFFCSLQKSHFLFARYTDPDALLLTLYKLQRRLQGHNLWLLGVPDGVPEWFELRDHLALYARPRGWMSPDNIYRLQTVHRATVKTVTKDCVELEGDGPGQEWVGVVKQEEASDPPVRDFSELRFKDGKTVLRARVLASECADGFSWYQCSLRNTLLVGPEDGDLVKRVRSLRIRTFNDLEIFEMVTGYVVQLEPKYVKVDIGFLSDYAYIPTHHIAPEQLQMYARGKLIPARIHNCNQFTFPCIELSLQELHAPVLDGARSIPAVSHKDILPGQTHSGLVVGVFQPDVAWALLRISGWAAEVFLGSRCFKRAFVPLPKDKIPKKGDKGHSIGTIVQVKITQTNGLRFRGAIVQHGPRKVDVGALLNEVRTKAKPPATPSATPPAPPTAKPGASSCPYRGAVRVTNLHPSVNRELLLEAFKRKGGELANVQPDPDTGMNKAVVFFKEAEQASQAAKDYQNRRLGESGQSSSQIRTKVADADEVYHELRSRQTNARRRPVPSPSPPPLPKRPKSAPAAAEEVSADPPIQVDRLISSLSFQFKSTDPNSVVDSDRDPAIPPVAEEFPTYGRPPGMEQAMAPAHASRYPQGFRLLAPHSLHHAHAQQPHQHHTHHSPPNHHHHHHLHPSHHQHHHHHHHHHHDHYNSHVPHHHHHHNHNHHRQDPHIPQHGHFLGAEHTAGAEGQKPDLDLLLLEGSMLIRGDNEPDEAARDAADNSTQHPPGGPAAGVPAKDPEDSGLPRSCSLSSSAETVSDSESETASTVRTVYSYQASPDVLSASDLEETSEDSDRECPSAGSGSYIASSSSSGTRSEMSADAILRHEPADTTSTDISKETLQNVSGPDTKAALEANDGAGSGDQGLVECDTVWSDSGGSDSDMSVSDGGTTQRGSRTPDRWYKMFNTKKEQDTAFSAAAAGGASSSSSKK